MRPLQLCKCVFINIYRVVLSLGKRVGNIVLCYRKILLRWNDLVSSCGARSHSFFLLTTRSTEEQSVEQFLLVLSVAIAVQVGRRSGSRRSGRPVILRLWKRIERWRSWKGTLHNGRMADRRRWAVRSIQRRIRSGWIDIELYRGRVGRTGRRRRMNQFWSGRIVNRSARRPVISWPAIVKASGFELRKGIAIVRSVRRAVVVGCGTAVVWARVILNLSSSIKSRHFFRKCADPELVVQAKRKKGQPKCDRRPKLRISGPKIQPPKEQEKKKNGPHVHTRAIGLQLQKPCVSLFLRLKQRNGTWREDQYR